MARPSNDLDQALLRSGRALFAEHGCALTLRALAEHAGVNPGMFHYHFKSKDGFLRLLLQDLYEQMFGRLQQQAAARGTARRRLRSALCGVAAFVREHRALLARLWMDALAGHPVAQEFLRDNAPRHIGVLAALLHEAETEGAIAPQPPLQRLAFIGGAVLMPLLFGGALADRLAPPAALRRMLDQQVMDDGAIAARVDLALGALQVAR